MARVWIVRYNGTEVCRGSLAGMCAIVNGQNAAHRITKQDTGEWTISSVKGVNE